MNGQKDRAPQSIKPSRSTNRDEASLPAYLQIARALTNRVASGGYGPGGQLPSVSQLCEEFHVSPMTVRRALEILENQGLVYGVRGRGTFARSVNLSDSMFRLDSLTGDWLDESAEIRLLSASIIRADQTVAEILRVQPGDRVIFLRRLVLCDGKPSMYHKEYIIYDPHRPVMESQVQLTSLHAFLDSGSVLPFPRGELTLTAVTLDPESSQALGECNGVSALCLEHVFQEHDGTPVSWGWFLMRAQLFRLRARLGPEYA